MKISIEGIFPVFSKRTGKFVLYQSCPRNLIGKAKQRKVSSICVGILGILVKELLSIFDERVLLALALTQNILLLHYRGKNEGRNRRKIGPRIGPCVLLYQLLEHTINYQTR